MSSSHAIDLKEKSGFLIRFISLYSGCPLAFIDYEYRLVFHNLFFERMVYAFLWVGMSEAVEQLRRRVAALTKEFEELESYKKDIEWLKTLQKKLIKEGYD